MHDVPLQVFLKDGISLIATQIGKPIMLDSFTSSMCIESWGQSNFARCLIEVKADAVLKDNITMGSPLPDGSGFLRKWFGLSTSGNHLVVNNARYLVTGVNVVPTVTTFVHTSSMKQHAKAVDNHRRPTIVLLLRNEEFVLENFTRSRGDVQDDMESEDEVEVFFDKTTNLRSSTITRANTHTAPDTSKN
ncbi:hypothetical protein Tco_0140471 [Tanacetum coccineum]